MAVVALSFCVRGSSATAVTSKTSVADAAEKAPPVSCTLNLRLA